MSTRRSLGSPSSLLIRMGLGVAFFAALVLVYGLMGRGPADLVAILHLACVSALSFAILWSPIHTGVASAPVRRFVSCVVGSIGLLVVAHVLWFVSPA